MICFWHQLRNCTFRTFWWFNWVGWNYTTRLWSLSPNTSRPNWIHLPFLNDFSSPINEGLSANCVIVSTFDIILFTFCFILCVFVVDESLWVTFNTHRLHQVRYHRNFTVLRFSLKGKCFGTGRWLVNWLWTEKVFDHFLVEPVTSSTCTLLNIFLFFQLLYTRSLWRWNYRQLFLWSKRSALEGERGTSLWCHVRCLRSKELTSKGIWGRFFIVIRPLLVRSTLRHTCMSLLQLRVLLLRILLLRVILGWSEPFTRSILWLLIRLFREKVLEKFILLDTDWINCTCFVVVPLWSRYTSSRPLLYLGWCNFRFRSLSLLNRYRLLIICLQKVTKVPEWRGVFMFGNLLCWLRTLLDHAVVVRHWNFDT